MIRQKTPTDLACYIQKYFYQYLIQQRRLSHHTILAYRDMFKLLLTFTSAKLNKSVSSLVLSDINADNILDFLHYLEKRRGNKIKTRNTRLAAIHSFCHYVAIQEPQILPEIQTVLSIPEKRTDHALFTCLDQKEMAALLNVQDLNTWTGQRDHLLLLMLYNTGARVTEIINIKFKDIDLIHQKVVHLHGKGRKERIIPLWNNTISEIKHWCNSIDSQEQNYLLPNRFGKMMSRFGVNQRLRCCSKKATIQCSSLNKKKITAHTIRHTTALHLLQSGVDLTVIALWLGHESIETTHQYMQANIEMKKQALSMLTEVGEQSINYQKLSDDVLVFLEKL